MNDSMTLVKNLLRQHLRPQVLPDSVYLALKEHSEDNFERMIATIHEELLFDVYTTGIRNLK